MIGGTLTSSPSFSPSINAEFKGTGNDYIHSDPDNGRMRLDAHGVLEIVDLTPEISAVLSGSPDAKTTDFGNSCPLPPSPLVFSLYPDPFANAQNQKVVNMTFETGSSKYRALESGVYVGAGRFVVQEDKSVVVEYRTSKVAW
ncbi:MAG: hypothetical protein Q9227_007438 [Pyrenula ochraceoflavens]